MLDRSSQESEGLTSDSNGPDTQSPSNAKPMPSAEKSSEGIGPKSQSTKTLLLATRPNPQTYFAEGSPAKTSPLPESEPDSQANDQDSSSRQPESLTLFSGTEAGFSLRMFPDFFPHKAEEISESFSRRFGNSGFWTEPGECWTVDTSECRSDGGVSSSLPDVLEADVAPRFYLSQKAAAGILRRAERRGKALPEHLESALQELSGQAATRGEADSTTLTDRERSSPKHLPPATDTTPRQRISSFVRRLTPTECERLQGFPDGWTIR